MPPPYPTLREYAQRPPTVIEGAPRADARVSIVTVVRNGAATIAETLRSVAAQIEVPIEHIVVDGGSTDGTLDIIRDAVPHPARWVSERDRGISDAMNKGVALASTGIIGFLNADDAYVPGAVAAGLARLDAHPEAGYSFGDLLYIDAHGDVAFTVRGDDRYAKKIGRVMPALNTPSILFRRELFETHGLFRREYGIALDYDFLLRLHLGGVRGVWVPQVMTRMRLGGISSRLVMETYREVLRISLAHQQPPLPAIGTYAALVAGHYIRQGLKRAGAAEIVQRLGLARFPPM